MPFTENEAASEQEILPTARPEAQKRPGMSPLANHRTDFCSITLREDARSLLEPAFAVITLARALQNAPTRLLRTHPALKVQYQSTHENKNRALT